MGDAGWTELLERVPHDIYHTPEYHALPGFGNRGAAQAFSYRETDSVFLWPYLLSEIDGGEGLTDVSSVYGYPGPVATGDAAFLQRAWAALKEHWKSQRVVSVFTRFHPLLANFRFFDCLDAEAIAGCRKIGPTVAIDLRPTPEDQVRSYQKVLRQQIRKTRSSGFVTHEDHDWQHAPEFVRIYGDTMARRNSRSDYLVDEAWMENFRRTLGGKARLFVTTWNGTVAAALIAMVHGPFVHAHLTGINGELAAHSPLKVLLDDIREWGTAQGLQSFHLGGGLGGREDSLFEFKRKFSPETHEFWTGSWIVDHEAYRALEDRHRSRLAANGVELGDTPFFPIYRYQP